MSMMYVKAGEWFLVRVAGALHDNLRRHMVRPSGDAATVDQPRALERAEELFDQADPNSKGSLSLAELQTIMQAASKEYSHLEEHARFLAG